MARVGFPSVPLEGEPRRIFGWISLLIFVNQLGFGSIIPVVPLYAESFGVSATAIGLTIAVYGLARFLVNVPAGRLADARGRRWTLALGGLLTVVGNLLCALAPEYVTLLIARFIAGSGASMVLTGGQIVLADIAPKAVRGRVMATYQGIFLFAVGAGGFPGGFLAEHFGLRAPFVVYACAAALVTFIAWGRVPETRGLRAGRPDTPAPSTAPKPVPATSQLRQVLTTPGFLAVSFVSFASFFARTGGLFSVVPLIAEDEIGLSPDQIGIGLGLVSLTGLFLTIPTGHLVDRFGRKPVIVPSTLLAVLAMISFSTASNFAWYLLACLFWGCANGVSGAAPAAYVADSARPGLTAATMGTYRSIADSGYVIGPLALGSTADLTSPRSALFVCAALSLAAGISFMRFAPETLSRHPTPVEAGGVTQPVPPSKPGAA